MISVHRCRRLLLLEPRRRRQGGRAKAHSAAAEGKRERQQHVKLINGPSREKLSLDQASGRGGEEAGGGEEERMVLIPSDRPNERRTRPKRAGSEEGAARCIILSSDDAFLPSSLPPARSLCPPSFYNIIWPHGGVLFSHSPRRAATCMGLSGQYFAARPLVDFCSCVDCSTRR